MNFIITGFHCILHYRQTSYIMHTKFQNLNVSRPILQLSLPNPLKPGATYIRGLTVSSLI